MNDKSEQKFQVNLVFTFKKETFQFSKNIPFLLKAFLHIYDDKWLPNTLAKDGIETWDFTLLYPYVTFKTTTRT